MAHDVFVSYSTKDKTVADTIVASLEKNGIRCWYAPRDIRPSDNWAKAISNAIEKSRLFLLIFSDNSNQSQHVLDELNVAISQEIMILPFRIENLQPDGAMRLHLSSRHWLDAYDPSWESYIKNLITTVSSNLGTAIEFEEIGIPETLKRKQLPFQIKGDRWVLAGFIIAALVIFAVWFGLSFGKKFNNENQNAETTLSEEAVDAINNNQVTQENVTPAVSKEPTSSSPPKVQSLIITFTPNPVSPTQDEDDKWIYWFAVNVENPNDSAMEVVAFGYGECLSVMGSCDHSASDFVDWFFGCDGVIVDRAAIPAHGTSCDKEFWYRLGDTPEKDVKIKFAFYFKDEDGVVHQAVSEQLTLRKP
jgi:hypothetical protein